MTVVVAYKYASNPQDASVDVDGKVNWSRAKPAVSEYDPVAIALGSRLAREAGSEIVGVSVGNSALSSSLAKKNAMSKGLDRALIVADDAVSGWNASAVASALAALVGQESDVDILLTGDSSIDEGSRMMSALVAGYLGWPCLQEVLDVQKTEGGYVITQAVKGGKRQVEVSGPVVVATTSDAVTVKVPSMKEILAAGKKPVTVAPVDELDVADVSIAVDGRSKPEPKARKNKIFKGDGAVSDLVSALRADGIL